MGEGGKVVSLGDRGGALAAGAVAGRQASKVATRAGGDYLKWRINVAIGAAITTDWLVDRWVQWKRERDEFAIMTGLGFGHPASESLREDLEALVVLAESEIRRIKAIVGPRRVMED